MRKTIISRTPKIAINFFWFRRKIANGMRSLGWGPGGQGPPARPLDRPGYASYLKGGLTPSAGRRTYYTRAGGSRGAPGPPPRDAGRAAVAQVSSYARLPRTGLRASPPVRPE